MSPAFALGLAQPTAHGSRLRKTVYQDKTLTIL